MSRTRHQRTEAAHRRRSEASSLLLWVLGADGFAYPDWTGRLERFGGKGVHLEPTVDCLREAFKRGVFRRTWGDAWKDTAIDSLCIRFAASATEALQQRLGLAVRAGALAVGQASSSEAMARSHRHGILFSASDAGDSAQAKFTRNAGRKNARVACLADGYWLGRATGREYVSVAWVDEPAFVHPLDRACRAVQGLPDSVVLSYESGVAAEPSATVNDAEGIVTGDTGTPVE
jgi:hypothetical protein